MQRIVGKGKESTRFIYDGDDVLADDNNGDLTKYQNGLGIDNKLRVQTGTDVKYFLSDHLGSTNGLTDASGAVTASGAYDAYGNPSNAGFPSRYQYTGREDDAVSGFYYYRARFYDPNLGRFASEDPIGFGGGDVNLYGYVWGNPTRFSDPSGLSGIDDTIAQIHEARSRAEQSVLEALETPLMGVIGFGDTASFGATRYLRGLEGIDHVNWDCSTAYQVGGWTAVAVQTVEGGLGIYRGGAAILRGIAARRLTAKAGAYSLYHGLDGASVVRYIGSTGREATIRFGEHGRAIGSGRELLDYEVVTSGLTKTDALAQEQLLINQYGLGKKGGQLINKINAVAPKNWPLFGIY